MHLIGNIHEDGARVILGPVVVDRIIAGLSAEQVLVNLEPAALTVLEYVANMFMPGAGGAIALVVWVIKNSRPMTWDEEQAWMNKSGIGSQS